MEKIIGTAIIAIITVLIWYLKTNTKHQNEREDKHDTERAKREDNHDKIQMEERLFYRKLVTNDMKELHQDHVKAAEVTNKSIVLIKGIGNSQKKLCTLIGNVDKKINGRK